MDRTGLSGLRCWGRAVRNHGDPLPRPVRVDDRQRDLPPKWPRRRGRGIGRRGIGWELEREELAVKEQKPERPGQTRMSTPPSNHRTADGRLRQLLEQVVRALD